MKPNQTCDYLVVGAGPAGLCAVAKLIAMKVEPKQIAWVDPQFEAGNFGTVLSEGSSVPGNTKVESYLKVISAIHDIIQSMGISPVLDFAMHQLDPNVVCRLKEAAEPIKQLIKQLRAEIFSVEGEVVSMNEQAEAVSVFIKNQRGDACLLAAKHVILATGASPKTMHHDMVSSKTIIDCHTVFTQSKLSAFLKDNAGVQSVAVIGSSHSAALAVMHLLKLGCDVHHFMIGDYRYAESKRTQDGKPYTKFDNTGLKGKVATFTKKLSSERYVKYTGLNKAHVFDLLAQHQAKFTHYVVAIGYQASSTLSINDKPLSDYAYDQTTLMLSGLSRVSGLGIAFPQKIIGHEGEEEFAVGLGKFWATVNHKAVLEAWKQPEARASHLAFFQPASGDKPGRVMGDDLARFKF